MIHTMACEPITTNHKEKNRIPINNHLHTSKKLALKYAQTMHAHSLSFISNATFCTNDLYLYYILRQGRNNFKFQPMILILLNLR